jgi:hypothetical protein
MGMRTSVISFLMIVVCSSQGISQNIGIGTTSPATRLDIRGGDNWDLVNGEGDLRIGNASYRLKMGIALGGGGVGAANIMQTGGIGNLGIGAGGKYLLQLNGPGGYVDFSNNSGGLRINGNAGAAGQVLTSNGAAAPSWNTLPNLYDNTQVFNSSAAVVVASGDVVDIPGLSYTFTLSGNAKVHVQFNIFSRAYSCFACNASLGSVGIMVNGAGLAWFTQTMYNDYYYNLDGSQVFDLGPGTYTIKLMAYGIGPDVTFGIRGTTPARVSNMIVSVIPK